MRKPHLSRTKKRTGDNLPRVQDSPPPDQREIATLAYSYWEARGCSEGSPEGDWFRAVDELRRRRQLP